MANEAARRAAEAATSMVRAALQQLDGSKTPAAAVESIALELLAADDHVAAAQAMVSLTSVGAAAIALLSQHTGSSTDELLGAFVRGMAGGGESAG
jgi:poly-gamma-glutamate capsule biosynthesis protein CapA/YwtB (metallophosphatase superfamily)